jgi:hypothetical protein
MGGAGGKFGKGGAGYLIPGTAGNYGGGNKTPDAANGSTGQDHSKTRANSGQVNRCEPPTTPPLTATAGTVDIKPSVRAPDGSTGFDPASAGVVRDHWFDLQAYLEMELQRARFAYLSMRVPVDAVTSDEDSAKAMVDASERLRWTLDLAKAALTPPSGGVAQSATDQEAVTYLKNLYARASALKERMDNGLDYFNHFPDWNPTLTLGYYERELGVASPETGGALYDYKKAEQDCLAAHEKLISVRDTAAARKQASALAVAQVNAYGVFIENSQAVRETLLQKIAAEQKEVEALHDELVTKIDDWTKEVEEQKSGLELRHVFEALSQFAFFPEGEGALVMFKQASMVIGQSGSVLTSAATPAPQEKWLLDQLAIAKHDVDALDESFRNAARGTIVLDDPNGSLILGERRTFDQLCGRFANESQGARDAMGSMDRYAETILKRNQTILRYNEVVNRIHAALAERDTAKHMLDSVRDAQAQADGSDLGIAAAQLGLALFQRKEECLRLLYEASRAYSLVTLQPDLTFHETVGLANPYDINAKTVRDAAATLVTQRRVNIDPMFPQQHLPVETGPSVVEEFGRAGGVRLTLKRGTTPLLFEGLTKGTGSVRFDVDELTNEPNAPFAEKLNVRIRAVRCWLHDLRGPGGAPDKAPAVYRVVLQHQGDSSFLTKDGIPVTRNHDPVSVDFSYDRSRSGDNDSYHGIYARDLRGVKDGILTADNHMLLSPFATWRIDLPDVAAGLADASGLDEIRFEFFLSYDTRIKPKK